MPYRSYLKFLTAITFSGVLLLVGFNIFIDPFTLFGSPKITGINALKTQFGARERLGKAIVVKRKRPNAVILGSSRAEVGLDPGHPGWRGQNTYNLALSAANIYEELRYLQHAEAVNRLNTALLAVDLFSFNVNFKNAEDFKEDYLAVNLDGRPNPTSTFNYVSTIFSVDMLRSSWNTLRDQSRVSASYYNNGMRTTAFIEAEVVSMGGRSAHFTKTEQAFVKGIWFPDNNREFLFRDPVDNISTFDYFQGILDVARENNTDLKILISPEHAALLATLDASGLWQDFEEWKRKLVQIISEDAIRYPSRAPVALWDFSGFNSITSEEIPAPGDKISRMKWYWDASHYTVEAGNMMQDKVFAYSASSRNIPDDFGLMLNSNNVEGQIARIRLEKLRWYQEHPELISTIFQQTVETLRSMEKN